MSVLASPLEFMLCYLITFFVGAASALILPLFKQD